jgi:threonyl-tRNA synthetase
MSQAEFDHRDVARRLDLLHFQPEAPGMVFWHAPGLVLYRALEQAARAHVLAQGYVEVRTPQIMRRPVWEASGHWSHFQHGMFRVEDQAIEAAIKPVSCPGHIYVLKQRLLSYRELPLRLCEFGNVHRDEPAGTLHGLLRLRQFTQDDGHVFCTEEQAAAEVVRFCRALPSFYRAFGFAGIEVALSTRPDERAGDDAAWDYAEASLSAALAELAVPHEVQAGQGAFYGPKIEFVLHDRQGRRWQCGTIQYDLVLPRRFDLTYIAADGQRRHPVMLHRALYGSLERFLGIVLEQYGAALPAWLSPLQVALLPVSASQLTAANELLRELRANGLRAEILAEDSLARRLAIAHERAVPYQVILGQRELAAGLLGLRDRTEQRSQPREAAISDLVARCASPEFDA